MTYCRRYNISYGYINISYFNNYSGIFNVFSSPSEIANFHPRKPQMAVHTQKSIDFRGGAIDLRRHLRPGHQIAAGAIMAGDIVDRG